VKVGTTIKAVYGLPRSPPAPWYTKTSTASAWDHVPGRPLRHTQRSTSDQLLHEGTLGKVTRALLELQLPLWGANKSTTKTMRLANCMRVATRPHDEQRPGHSRKGCRIFSNRAQVMEVVRQLNHTPRAQDCDFLAPLFEIGITWWSCRAWRLHILTGKALTALRKHVGTPRGRPEPPSRAAQ
jgi:hypothetical protein